MGSDWRDCIVTFIDLPGVKKLASANSAGSDLMRRLHALAARELPRLAAIDHAYVWNDSVLLLSFIKNTPASFVAAMTDAHRFKRRVNGLKKCYAVAVKGQAFPPLPDVPTSKLTVLQASSWAMANCFEIEKQLGNVRAAWYVDGRIARHLRDVGASVKRNIVLLPLNRKRSVFCYADDLWDEV
jgi:hypothetical protein